VQYRSLGRKPGDDPHSAFFEIWASMAGGPLGGAAVKLGEKVADAAFREIGEQMATHLSAWLTAKRTERAMLRLV
jgi:hypothetical protein